MTSGPLTTLRWGGFVVGIIACSLLIWVVVDRDQKRQLNALMRAQAAYEVDMLGRDLEVRARAVSLIGDTSVPCDDQTEARFLQNAHKQLENIPGLHALSMLSANQQTEYVAHAQMNEEGAPGVLDVSTQREEELDRARASGRMQVSGVVELLDGSGPGLIVSIPIQHEDVLTGFVTAVFNIETWSREVVSSRQSFSPSILADGVVILPLGTDTTDGTQSDLISFQGDLFERQFLFQFTEHPEFRDRYRSAVPELTSLFGLACLSVICICLVSRQQAKHAQQRLASVNNTLQLYADRLEEEMTERKLAEAEANRMREATSHFLTTIGRDIRTPFSAIICMFELIRRSKGISQFARDRADTGLDTTQRLFRQLRNVLDASRLDSNAVDIEPEDIKTQELVEDWVDLANALLERSGKDIELVIQVSDHLPEMVTLDAARVTQIVENLMDNAITHTETGSVGLHVGYAAGPGNFLLVKVSDSGPGVAPDRQAGMFDRHYQTPTGPERTDARFGLGLSISRDLATLMGGTLCMEDRSRGGCLFSLKLFSVGPAKVPSEHVNA